MAMSVSPQHEEAVVGELEELKGKLDEHTSCSETLHDDLAELMRIHDDILETFQKCEDDIIALTGAIDDTAIKVGAPPSDRHTLDITKPVVVPMGTIAPYEISKSTKKEDPSSSKMKPLSLVPSDLRRPPLTPGGPRSPVSCVTPPRCSEPVISVRAELTISEPRSSVPNISTSPRAFKNTKSFLGSKASSITSPKTTKSPRSSKFATLTSRSSDKEKTKTRDKVEKVVTRFRSHTKPTKLPSAASPATTRAVSPSIPLISPTKRSGSNTKDDGFPSGPPPPAPAKNPSVKMRNSNSRLSSATSESALSMRGIIRVYSCGAGTGAVTDQFKSVAASLTTTVPELITMALKKYSIISESSRCANYDLLMVKMGSEFLQRLLSPDECPLQIVRAWEGEPDKLRFFLKKKISEESQGEMRVYAGLGMNDEKADSFRNILVDVETLTTEVIRLALLEYSQDAEHPVNWELSEVQLQNGIVERVMEEDEFPFKAKQLWNKRGVKDDMARFYLRKRKNPGFLKGTIKIYGGLLGAAIGEDYKSISVSTMTTVPEVIKMGLDKFSVPDDAVFSLLEVKYNTSERVMAADECPFQIKLQWIENGCGDVISFALRCDNDDLKVKCASITIPVGDDKTLRLQSIKNIIESVRNVTDNTYCAECSSSDPRFVSSNLGILLCYDCAQIHHALSDAWRFESPVPGTRLSQSFFSKVRSLGGHRWDSLMHTYLLAIGNSRMNEVMEHGLIYSTDHCKPLPGCDAKVRHGFISTKYKEKAFLDPVHELDGTPATASTLDAELLRIVSEGNAPHVLRLLLLGADPNAYAIDGPSAGFTTLHVAASGGHFAAAMMLLEHGMNPMLRSKDDRTALYYAAHHGQRDLIELIRQRQRSYYANGSTKEVAASKPASRMHHTSFRDIINDLCSEIEARDQAMLLHHTGVSHSESHGGEGRKRMAMLSDDNFMDLAENMFYEMDIRQRDIVRTLMPAIADDPLIGASLADTMRGLEKLQNEELAVAERDGVLSPRLHYESVHFPQPFQGSAVEVEHPKENPKDEKDEKLAAAADFKLAAEAARQEAKLKRDAEASLALDRKAAADKKAALDAAAKAAEPIEESSPVEKNEHTENEEHVPEKVPVPINDQVDKIPNSQTPEHVPEKASVPINDRVDEVPISPTPETVGIPLFAQAAKNIASLSIHDRERLAKQEETSRKIESLIQSADMVRLESKKSEMNRRKVAVSEIGVFITQMQTIITSMIKEVSSGKPGVLVEDTIALVKQCRGAMAINIMFLEHVDIEEKAIHQSMLDKVNVFIQDLIIVAKDSRVDGAYNSTVAARAVDLLKYLRLTVECIENGTS